MIQPTGYGASTDVSPRTDAPPRLRRALSRVRMALAAFILALGLSVTAGSSTANAEAFGCNGWTGVPTPWGTYSANNFCARITGSGTYVQDVRGSFTTNFGSVCNYNTTAEFFDYTGRWYKTLTSPTRWGCTWGTVATPTIPVYQYMYRGSMCSTLKQNGARLTSVCHNIG